MGLGDDKQAEGAGAAHSTDGVVREEQTDKGLGPLSTPAEAPAEAKPAAAPSEAKPGEPRHVPRAHAKGGAPVNFAATLIGIAPPAAVKVTASGERPSMQDEAAHEKLDPGALFAGAFRVAHELPSNGPGTLYEAEQSAEARRCALRVMHRPGVPEAARKHFVDEAKLAASAGGAPVLRVYDAGFDEPTGLFWVATERVEGETLAERLDKLGADASMPADDAWKVVAQVLNALAYAHGHGVVHRDLKPSNVILTAGDVKLTGFGVAHLRDPKRDEGRLFPHRGAALWMAPEQAAEGASVSPAADVWSVGLLAFRVLTGRSYWLVANKPEIDLSELLSEMIQSPRKPASARAEELGRPNTLPEGFDAWFTKCLMHDPATRYADAEEALHALTLFAPASVAVPGIEYGGLHSRPTIPIASRAAPVAGSHVISADRETIEPETVLRIPSVSAPMRPQAPVQRSAFDEAPTIRMRQLSPDGASVIAPSGHASGAPGHASAHPSGHPAVIVKPEALVDAMPAPAPPPPPKPRKRPWGTIAAALVMAGACLYALNIAAGPGGLLGVFRSRGPVRPAPVEPDPLMHPGHDGGLAGGPPPWPANASRLWNGTLTNDNTNTQLSYVLVLRVNETGHASGFFSWTVGRMVGARSGEQVRETVEGTYEPTMGVLDLHGVLSTNPVVLPVNAYRVRLGPAGEILGDTLDGMSHITGTLGTAPADASTH